MAPPYQNSFPSDHHHDLDHLLFPTTPQPSSSSSSSTLSFSLGLSLGLDHAHSEDLSHPLDLKQDQGGEIVGSNNDNEGIEIDDDVETELRFSIWKQIDKRESSIDNDSTLKWPSSSSKIRMVINSNQTKMATPMVIDGSRNFQDLNRSSPSDQIDKQNMLNAVNDNNPVIRTCSDCNTTKTPLWRSGPRGPKSLCNACGIRQRKARRAAMAAAGENSTVPYGEKPAAAAVLKTNKTAVQHKIIKPATGVATLKRKCKDVAAGRGGGRKKLRFEDSSYQRVFPQDEREAAILLMTLSYGWPSSWFNF